MSGSKYNNIIEFSIFDLKKNLSEGGSIIVPSYQRGISWKKSDRENLVDSLLNKYPFGCLLLYKIDDNKYKIIDGLQRSYTLIDFYDKPLNYFEKFIKEKIIILFDSTNEFDDFKENQNDLINFILKYVLDNCLEVKEMLDIDIQELTFKIIEEWNIIKNNKNILVNFLETSFKEFYESYISICNNFKVPALIFIGSEEKLPEIFERINTEGKKLTKYQVYAATWTDDMVELKNDSLQEIIRNVQDRYNSYLKSIGNLDIDSRKLNKVKEISVFDMIYGFGKMICKEYKNLFLYEEGKDEVDKIESVGFNLINACLLQKSSNMKNLNIVLKKYVGYDSQNISLFLLNIIECIKYVDKKLSRGTKFKGNKEDEIKSSPLHSELQIISIIASLFVLKYAEFDVSDKGLVQNIKINQICNSDWSSVKKHLFDCNVLKIYSLDLIDSKWKGSGDSKLYNIITNKKYYLRNIEWIDFEQCLDNYFNSQKNERNERFKVANPNSADKLILNLVYTNIFKATDQLDDSSYDIEHLSTKAIMKAKIQEFSNDFSLPISSIGNLCLLPKEYNEKKGEKVMYQFKSYYDREQKKEIFYPINKYEKIYTFTKELDFDWLLNTLKDCTEEQFRKNYYNFLNKRFKSIKKKIKDNLFS